MEGNLRSDLDGVVLWFDQSKGFGIISADKTSYFAHWTDVETKTDGESILHENDKVTFSQVVSQRSGAEMQAKNIVVISSLVG